LSREKGARSLAISPHVGVLPLAASHLLLTHVLGRKRVIVTRELLDASIFDPLAPERPTPLLVSSVVAALRSANVLQPIGYDDAEQIRAAFRTANSLSDRDLGPVTLSPVGFGHDEETFGAYRLSGSLARIELDDASVLVTHPAGPPTHLESQFWEFARSFHRGRRVQPGEERACAFLCHRLILWPAESDEASVSAGELGFANSPMPELFVTNRAADAYRQIHKPYTRSHVEQPARRCRIMLIGPCMAQQFAECLEHQGYQHGYAFYIRALREPTAAIEAAAPNAIVINANQFTSYLVQFAMRADWDACDQLVVDVVQAIAERLLTIRAYSAAPLLIAVAHAPSLGSFPPGSVEALRLRLLFDQVNLGLADRAGAFSPCRLIDEMDARERIGIPSYWDDWLNSSAHRAPTSSWNWIHVASDSTNPIPARRYLAPTPRVAQCDPSLAMSLEIIRGIAEQDCWPIATIVFEPRGLLWPLEPSSADLDRAARRSFLADVEDYCFAGLAEALAELARRGRRLVCLSDMPETALARGFSPLATADTLLSTDQVETFVSTRDKASILRSIAVDAPRGNVLWIDLTTEARPAIDRVTTVTDMRTGYLRDILLRAPELTVPLAGPQIPIEQGNIAAESALQARHCVLAVFRDAVRAERADVDADTIEHLADLGFDSLSMLRLVLKMEEQLGVTLAAWDKSNTDLFLVERLVAAFTSALRRRKQEAADACRT
jgi:acyl carrier protein